MHLLPLNRRQLRRTAAVVLASWVFALLSGVAHACLMPAAAADGSLVTGLPTGTRAMDAAAPLQQPTPHDHRPAGHADSEPANDSGQAACLKFCADESSARTKGETPSADLAQAVPLIGARWQRLQLSSTPVPRRQVDRPASVGPPLFLRLLRLTI